MLATGSSNVGSMAAIVQGCTGAAKGTTAWMQEVEQRRSSCRGARERPPTASHACINHHLETWRTT